MYKKMVLGLAVGIFAFSLVNFSSNVWAEEVEGSVWAGSPEYGDTEDGVVTTSDGVVVEEVDIEEEEIEEEPAMWPVYLSFGAIGTTFLLVLIINLSARKYNKK